MAAARSRFSSRCWSAYDFIRRTLVQFDYAALGKADKGAVKAYMAKMTGLSRAQLTRLVRQYRESGPPRPSRRWPGAALREALHRGGRLARRGTGAAMRPGHSRASPSSSSSPMHRASGRTVERAPPAPIAHLSAPAHRSPRPGPGRCHATGVLARGHRLDGAKGVYHINTVDEVPSTSTSAPWKRSRRSVPVPPSSTPIRLRLWAFPNGGFVRHKLHIGQFTKWPVLQRNALVDWSSATTSATTTSSASRHRSTPSPKGCSRSPPRWPTLEGPYEKLKSLPDAARFRPQ